MVKIHENEQNDKFSWSWWEFCDLFQWNQGLITGLLKMSIKEHVTDVKTNK